MSAALDAPIPREPAARRGALPVLALIVLLGMVFLLPRREPGAGPAPQQVAGLPAPAPLAVMEPPSWALQRGVDATARALDRLTWGGADALAASRHALAPHRGRLADELLSRLRTLGEDGSVAASRLIELLALEDPEHPGLVDELVRWAHARRALPAKAALRALARIEHSHVLDGILPRLVDADPDVASHARAALAERARRGDEVAQAVVLDELEAGSVHDMAFLAALDSFPSSERLSALLAELSASDDPTESLVALATRLRRGDAAASAEFERLMGGTDALQRLNALRTVATAQRVLGREHWEDLAWWSSRPELLALMEILLAAIDQGHDAAPEAVELLERLSASTERGVRSEALDALYVREHPWAVETTRQVLRSEVGALLAEAAARAGLGAPSLRADMAALGLGRLADPSLRPEDRVALARMLSQIAPEPAADPLVRIALAPATDAATAAAAAAMGPLLAQVGDPALRRLEAELGSPEGRLLFVRLARQLGSPAALPGLRALLLDPAADDQTLFEGLDALAALRGGPREEALREVLAARRDERVDHRGRLLFWNYL